MSIAPLTVLAAEHSQAGDGMNPWVVGGIVLLIFVTMLGALLAFGAGRDHT